MQSTKQYVVTMNNYFISHKTMRSLCEHNLAGLGTARANNIRAEEMILRTRNSTHCCIISTIQMTIGFLDGSTTMLY